MATATKQQQTAAQKPSETSRERFVRLAEGRMSKALTALEQVRALAQKDRYEYTEPEAKKIVDAIRDEANKLEEAFKAGEIERGVKFKL